jgi:hypothetical protein
MPNNYNPKRGQAETGNYIDRYTHWLNLQVFADEQLLKVFGGATTQDRKICLGAYEILFNWWGDYIRDNYDKNAFQEIRDLLSDIRQRDSVIELKEQEIFNEDNDEDDLYDVRIETLKLININISKLSELDKLLKHVAVVLNFNGVKISKYVSEKEQRDRTVRGI